MTGKRRTFVAGHRGLVGSALVRRLEREPDSQILTATRENESAEHINVGSGKDLSIRELAEMVREVVYPDATLLFDTSKPDGTPRKLLDVSRLLALGWHHRIALREGLADTYRWFYEHQASLRASEVAQTAPNAVS